MFKKAQTVDINSYFEGVKQSVQSTRSNLTAKLIKRQSKRDSQMMKEPSIMTNFSGEAPPWMGKVCVFAEHIPQKQKLDKALEKVNKATLILQKWVSKVLKRARARRAFNRMDQFVKGYYFDQCRELFYADLFRVDEKKEEQLQKQEKRE